jgi:hypothetical protein
MYKIEDVSSPTVLPSYKSLTYRVSHMFEYDLVTYVSLKWLEISKFPSDMMYANWWTTYMQKMSPLIM